MCEVTTRLAELLLQLPLGGVQTLQGHVYKGYCLHCVRTHQPEHPEAGVGLGRVPAALVPPPVGHRGAGVLPLAAEGRGPGPGARAVASAARARARPAGRPRSGAWHAELL